MFSVSPAELLTITVVALLVFGPRHLPEIIQKFGSALREMRRAADELKSGISQEYDEVLGPLDEARLEIKAAFDSDSVDPSPLRRRRSRPQSAPDAPPLTGDRDGAPGPKENAG